jgi:hypothetical protein
MFLTKRTLLSLEAAVAAGTGTGAAVGDATAGTAAGGSGSVAICLAQVVKWAEIVERGPVQEHGLSDCLT